MGLGPIDSPVVGLLGFGSRMMVQGVLGIWWVLTRRSKIEMQFEEGNKSDGGQWMMARWDIIEYGNKLGN